jgi:hypothetical protein
MSRSSLEGQEIGASGTAPRLDSEILDKREAAGPRNPLLKARLGGSDVLPLEGGKEESNAALR